MKYNFSDFLNNSNNIILNEFIDKYTACIDTYDSEKVSIVLSYYKDILDILDGSFESIEILKLFEELAKYKISLDVPYIIMTNEIYGLKNILISKMTDKNINLKILDLLSIFQEVNNKVAQVYLSKYIERLLSLNNLRINSLSDLVEKNIIGHYESHLIWLTSLAEHIKDKNKKEFPQLDDKMCEFGKWLHSDAKLIIQNNSKYIVIDRLHSNLHLFAKKIFSQIGKEEHHILITYLEKCELISLSIGTELALIDNIIMNKQITKDSLTGALNRQGLRSVFESQYELSLATNNPFVLAMCDLDFFKDINDNYGHVAGDKLLKLFVDTVKQNIRSSDVIVRYGGEEFIIMLPAIKKDKGLAVLENIRQSFEKATLKFGEENIKATVSIGMMEIKPEHYFKQSFIDEYIMIVDQKLYIAKESGRNRVEMC